MSFFDRIASRRSHRSASRKERDSVRVTRSKTTTVKAAPPRLSAIDVTQRDPEGRTPLHDAARHGYVVTARALFAQEADVNARDAAGRTPAHWAAFKGYLDVVRLLVTSGADLNARDEGGRTLLRMAIVGNQSAVEQFLRNEGGTV
jgi:ankyrin repeat protein